MAVWRADGGGTWRRKGECPSRWSEAMRSFAVCAAGLAAAALGLAIAVPQAAAASGPSFVRGVLPPPPAGSTTTFNQAAEPQIRSDPAGNFYISSENGLGSGTDAWSSVNGGRAYRSLPRHLLTPIDTRWRS